MQPVTTTPIPIATKAAPQALLITPPKRFRIGRFLVRWLAHLDLQNPVPESTLPLVAVG